MPLRRILDAIDPWIGIMLTEWTGHQRFHVGVVQETCLEPTLIGGVLQEASHQVRHSWNHLANWHILADAQTHGHGRGLERVAHAVQHLQFNCRLRHTALLQRCERCSDRSCIVGTKRQFHTAFAALAGRVLNEVLRDAFEACVGVTLAAPHRNWPSLLLSVDGFVIPVRTLDQPNSDHAPGSLGPIDNAACIVGGTAQIRLHGQSGFKVHRFAASLKELNSEVFQRKLLHIKVHQHAVLLGTFQNRHDLCHQRADRTLGINGVNACAE